MKPTPTARHAARWNPADCDVDTTVVTVNRRLAGELRNRHDRARIAAGQRVWPSIDVLPWDAWLARCYTTLIDSGHVSEDLLTPTQERLCWQRVIELDPAAGALLRPAAAAQAAQDAYRLMRDWQLDRAAIALDGGEDSTRFLAWCESFEAALADAGQTVRAQLLPRLAAAVAAGRLSLPRRLVHSGFDSLAPAQSALFAALAEAGCEVVADTADGVPGHCRRIEADDPEQEMRLAARWGALRLAEQPGCRIGVVAVDIAARRADLERVFGALLAPARYLHLDSTPKPFDLSLGEPLAERPLVAHALHALALAFSRQSLGTLGQLLRSPFIGGHGSEWARRAALDLALRHDGMPMLDLARLRGRLERVDADAPAHCADLAARLDRFAARRDGLPRQAEPNTWVGHFRALLAELGWPGDEPLDSHEYQAHERLTGLLSEFATLGKVCGRLSGGEALALLRELARETLFQPESSAVTVQILGPLEAAGMRFDALWLLGMHDQTWPPPARPDPLLPAALQRALDMPHASATRELAFARVITGRLACSAETLIASHARQDGDRALQVSPLLADWASCDAVDLLGDAGAADPLACGALAACADPGPLQAPVPPAAPPPHGELRGGAALLGAQANCPFQAVARFRLQAEPLEEATFAADARLLGNLLHELLHRTWQQLGDSAALAAHDDAALERLVRPLAAAVVEDLGRPRPDIFTPAFRQLEVARLTRLVLDWLSIERERSQAFAIAALEQTRVIELGGLPLRTRADRVDRLADGSLAVVDYKTGRTVSHAGWFDERLSEPQLPLYCATAETGVSAALLARVRRDGKGPGYVGISRDPDFAPGVVAAADTPDAEWETLRGRWLAALGTLAGEVLAGRADPTPSPAACQYCPLGALCRARPGHVDD